MTQYAPIAPIDCLLKLQAAGFLGNYLVLLAHEVVAEVEKYEKLIREFSGTIMMDNSLIELGEPVDVETMMAAIEITGADYAVLPDKLLKMEETIEASTTALRQWQEIGLGTQHVIVAQGVSVDECVFCVQQIIDEMPERDPFVISVPRALVEILGTRLEVIKALQKNFNNVPIHLLGFSCNYFDDIRCARYEGIMGIDSATPIRLGMEGKIMPISNSEVDPADGINTSREIFFKTCKSVNSTIVYNLGAIRGAITVGN